jgi:hypothetical protein
MRPSPVAVPANIRHTQLTFELVQLEKQIIDLQELDKAKKPDCLTQGLFLDSASGIYCEA